MLRNKRFRSYSCWSYSESLGVTPGVSKNNIGTIVLVCFFRAHVSSMARTLDAGIMSAITVFGAMLSIEYNNDTLMQLLGNYKSRPLPNNILSALLPCSVSERLRPFSLSTSLPWTASPFRGDRASPKPAVGCGPWLWRRVDWNYLQILQLLNELLFAYLALVFSLMIDRTWSDSGVGMFIWYTGKNSVSITLRLSVLTDCPPSS